MLLKRATFARSLTWAAAVMLLAGPAQSAGEKPAAAGNTAKVAAAGATAQAGAAGPAPGAAAPALAATNAPPSAGEVALRRGIEAYQKGDTARAIGAFSSAMSKGGLTSPSLAKALLYRGLSYRKQGKPAQAIPDLTNALYIKDGLAEAERGEAIAARTAAYRDAGIADPTGVPAAAPTAQAVASPQAPSAPASVPVASSPAGKPSGGAWQTAAAPGPGAGTSAAAAAEAAPAQPASSGGIGGFFSNLFGGSGDGAAPAASNDVTTASTGASATAPASAPTAAVSSWSNATEVTQRAAAKGQRTAAAQPAAAVSTDVAPAAPAAPKRDTAGGKYKLQVAAVRSRGEADALAARLVSEHAGKLGGRAPVVEEAVFGSMGTFYRVNIGSYAAAAEPDSLCKALRPSGFDCLVVTH